MLQDYGLRGRSLKGHKSSNVSLFYTEYTPSTTPFAYCSRWKLRWLSGSVWIKDRERESDEGLIAQSFNQIRWNARTEGTAPAGEGQFIQEYSRWSMANYYYYYYLMQESGHIGLIYQGPLSLFYHSLAFIFHHLLRFTHAGIVLNPRSTLRLVISNSFHWSSSKPRS